MPLRHLHLLRPHEDLLPGLDSWLVEVMGMLSAHPKWRGCEIVRDVVYDRQAGFNAQSVADRVLRQLGPVVILQNVKTPDRLELGRRIGTRTVIVTRSVDDSTSLWQALEDAHDQYVAGDPRLKRGLVLALLLMNKLEKLHMWGGKNKGYKWAADLPTGKGMPEDQAIYVPSVISQLLGADVLIRKTSQGKSKYALNPARKPEIFEALRNQSLDGFPTVARVFNREEETLSARVLDALWDQVHPDGAVSDPEVDEQPV